MFQTRPAAALFAASLLPVLAAAQPTETLIVSAARIPIPVVASGGSVSVIEREEIERRQQIYAAELLTLTPGLSVSRSGSAGSQTQLRLRGAEANQILVLIDGIKANDAAGNDEFAFEHLTSFDIERIEVVRGPQSALWGSDALAGVINIITRQPGGSLEAEAFAEAGAFDSLHGGGRISGPLGPVRAGLSLSRVDSDGTNSARTGSEDDGYDNTTASLNLAASPRPGLELALTGRLTAADKAFDTTDLISTGLPADSATRPESDITLGFVGAGGTLAMPGGRWTHSLRGSWSTSDTANTEVDPGSGQRREVNAVGARRYGFRYQSTWRPAGWSEAGDTALTFALDQEWQEFSQQGMATEFGDPNQDQDLDNTAAVVELRLAPAEDLSLSFSGRYDDNSDFEDIGTFRITGAWTVSEAGTRLRASLGTGQKAPTFSERFGFYPDQFQGNPDLKPEESRGWELGLDQPLADGRVRLGATYFRQDLRNEINGFVFDPDVGEFGGFTAENLAGRSRRRGVELTADAEPARDLLLRVNYTYTDSRQPDAAGGALQREIRRPRNSGSLNAAYTFAGGRVTADLGLAITGDRTDNFFEVAPPFGVQTVELDGYTLASLALTWRVHPRFALLARVENAFNSTYEDVLGYNTPGIGAYLGFRARLAPIGQVGEALE